MLSFFRTKSTETSVDKIVNGTKVLSLDVDETPMDVAKMQSIADDDVKDSLQSLGYQDEIQLRDTIYGMTLIILNNSFIFLHSYIFILAIHSTIELISVIYTFIFIAFSGILRTIRDPEKPSTLEDLKVVYEDGIFIQPPTSDNVQVVCLCKWYDGCIWQICLF